MPTPQELRERRQAKIRAGGADRLARITKTALPDEGSADYKGLYTPDQVTQNPH